MQCRWDVDAMQMGRGWHELYQSAPFLWFLRVDRRSSVSLDNTKQAAIHTLASITCAAKNMNSGLFVWCCRAGRSTSYCLWSQCVKVLSCFNHWDWMWVWLVCKCVKNGAKEVLMVEHADRKTFILRWAQDKGYRKKRLGDISLHNKSQSLWNKTSLL